MTTVHTFASGSSGNALLFSWDGGHLLLDAGISCRRILSALSTLGLSAADLDGILISHTHTDHVHGLQTLLKRTDCPVYASERACRELDYRFAGIRDRLFPIDMGAGVDLNTASARTWCRATAVPASHDAPGTCGWRLDNTDGGFAFLTDTGLVTEAARSLLPGARFVLLEANHDIEAVRSGPYPLSLKERILGPWGHLSNEDAGEFAADLARAGAERIVLAHLSPENNTPAMAEAAVRRALDAGGLSPALTTAPRDGLLLAYQAGTPETDQYGSGARRYPVENTPAQTAAQHSAPPRGWLGEAALCGG